MKSKMPNLSSYSIIKCSCSEDKTEIVRKQMQETQPTYDELLYSKECGQTYWGFFDTKRDDLTFSIVTDEHIKQIKKSFKRRGLDEIIKVEDVSRNIIDGEYPVGLVEAIKKTDKFLEEEENSLNYNWKINQLLGKWIQDNITKDVILDKISKKGISSLKEYEKSILAGNYDFSKFNEAIETL